MYVLYEGKVLRNLSAKFGISSSNSSPLGPLGHTGNWSWLRFIAQFVLLTSACYIYLPIVTYII